MRRDIIADHMVVKLLKELIDTPDRIYVASDRLDEISFRVDYELQTKIKENEFNITGEEAGAAFGVSTQVDEVTGKKVFTNDAQREVAATVELTKNEAYKRMLARRSELQIQLGRENMTRAMTRNTMLYLINRHKALLEVAGIVAALCHEDVSVGHIEKLTKLTKEVRNETGTERPAELAYNPIVIPPSIARPEHISPR